MSDVKEYVSTCDVCQRVDGKLGKQHAELHPIPVSDVWKQVHALVFSVETSRFLNQKIK